MKIKVCGMKDPQNINEVASLLPDFLGFIFYKKSARYVEEIPLRKVLSNLDSGIEKVGVFVDEASEIVVGFCNRLGLSHAQLHGKESPEYCAQIQKAGISVIKVFHMGETFDLDQIKPYENCSDLLLFDTKTKDYGGSGKHFDWNLLKRYTSETPFLLSGGISPEDITKIKELQIPQLWGIDVNSRVEMSPAYKDVNKVKELILKTREG
jgi:phosphoribosylanthranilate isomerase